MEDELVDYEYVEFNSDVSEGSEEQKKSPVLKKVSKTFNPTKTKMKWLIFMKVFSIKKVRDNEKRARNYLELGITYMKQTIDGIKEEQNTLHRLETYMMAYAICINFVDEGRDLIKDNKSAVDIWRILQVLKIGDENLKEPDAENELGFYKTENPVLKDREDQIALKFKQQNDMLENSIKALIQKIENDTHGLQKLLGDQNVSSSRGHSSYFNDMISDAGVIEGDNN